MLLTPGESRALVDGVWSGQYSAEKLPPWLFDRLADGYQGAAVRGWGNTLGTGAIKDQALELAMQENVFFFAAHKTAHQLKDMNQLLIASTSKYDFVKKALQVNEKYNNTWFNTEYGVTKRIARAGRDWKRIEESADIYPTLTFIAVQDGNTRRTHAALHGITRAVADAFWKTYYPPLDWSCRCRARRNLPNTAGTTPLPPAKDLPLVIEQFKARVTDSRKIWSLDHPYFTAPLAPIVKKVIIPKLVAEKIAKEKPWSFPGGQELEKQLRAKYPGVEINIYAEAEAYNVYMRNFDIPRFIDNLEAAFNTTTAKGISSPSRITSIEFTGNNRHVRFLIKGQNQYGEIILKRTFSIASDGLKSVEHDFFKIPKPIQGGGFSKRTFQVLYKEYQAVGIEHIHVHAGLEMGGYVWGRYGFCRDLDATRGWVNYKLGGNLKTQALEVITNFEIKHPGELFPMNRLAEMEGMKENLMGTDWIGELYLKNKTQKDVFENYLYGKKEI